MLKILWAVAIVDQVLEETLLIILKSYIFISSDGNDIAVLDKFLLDLFALFILLFLGVTVLFARHIIAVMSLLLQREVPYFFLSPGWRFTLERSSQYHRLSFDLI